MDSNPYIQEGGIENYTGYQPGGYHPVHLGDKFKDGRYTIVHKLGYGTFSTVWLVRDEAQGSLASLKILTADASECSSGTELDVFRRSAAGSGEGKRFVLQLLDSFVHQGPNGEHLCVVTEVSGPNLATFLWALAPEEELTPELARAFVLHLAKGVEYLHSCGIIHGDLHLGNMLYHLPILSTLKSPEEIAKYFGVPETLPIRVVEGTSPLFNEPHIPRYVVHLPDYTVFFEQLFQSPSLAELKICDFSESSPFDPAHASIKRKLNCPNIHAAPEVIFDDLASPASDIWAMGNTMHQIMDGGGTEGRTAIPGTAGCSSDEVLCGMIRIFGKLPERWWNSWEKRGEYFDGEGLWVAEKELLDPPRPLGTAMHTSFFPGGRKEPFVKILYRMFEYEPEDRLTAHALVEELGWLAVAEDQVVVGPGFLASNP
ncbi:kinase-like domain-containing protein [Coprinopsis sp. MPI-PUGE-AT-0042]|nr:kinase-like domain-containing protein [Coprinopsis sp. MPI-PUGE-AT-0042]